MVFSPLRSKPHFHARSVSLPSGSHPLVSQFDEHLCRIKSNSEATPSLSSIGKRLGGLEDLYDRVEDLLQLPHTQQALVEESNKKCVDEALEGHLRVLDLCAATEEVVSRAKQDVQELLSILRRRRDSNDFGGYLASRKKLKKVIEKSLREMKPTKSKNSHLSLDKDREAMSVLRMIDNVEEVTLALFESLLCYIGDTKGQPKIRSWSLVSKIMQQKISLNQDHEKTNANAFGKVEIALHSLVNHSARKSDNVVLTENVQTELREMESSIQDFEEGLECLFRRLIKTRVSFLNILNH